MMRGLGVLDAVVAMRPLVLTLNWVGVPTGLD